MNPSEQKSQRAVTVTPKDCEELSWLIGQTRTEQVRELLTNLASTNQTDIGAILEAANAQIRSLNTAYPLLHRAINAHGATDPYGLVNLDPTQILTYLLDRSHFTTNTEARFSEFIFFRDNNERTPFLHAVSKGSIVSLDLLKAAGAVSDDQHDRRDFAVHLATLSMNEFTLQWLFDEGFDFSKQTAYEWRRWTMAHIAVLLKWKQGILFLHQKPGLRHVLEIKGGEFLDTAPLAMCLEESGRDSNWYRYLYYGFGLDLTGLPLPM